LKKVFAPGRRHGVQNYRNDPAEQNQRNARVNNRHPRHRGFQRRISTNNDGTVPSRGILYFRLLVESCSYHCLFIDRWPSRVHVKKGGIYVLLGAN